MERNIDEIIAIYTHEKERLLHSADKTNLKTNFLESLRLFKISIDLLEKYTAETKHQHIEIYKISYKCLHAAGKARGFIS